MHPVTRIRLAGPLVLAALVVAACGGEPDIPLLPTPTPTPAPTRAGNGSGLVIGASFPVLDPAADPYLASLADALQRRASAVGDVDLQVVSAEGSTDTQLEQVQAFVDAKVDAVIIVPDDTGATAPLTSIVRGARIPLLYLNRKPDGLPSDGSIPYVGSDSLAAGTMEMQALATRADGRGTVGLLIGDPANEAAVRRTEGAKDVIVDNPGMTLLREAAANWDRQHAHDTVQAWLTAGDRFDVICANDDVMALGAIDALREAELLDRTIVGGVDGIPDGLKAIADGDLDVTVFQDARLQGSTAIDTALQLMRGARVTTDEGVIDVPQTLVTKANVDAFLEASPQR
jgi:inositol transport system substrate-binding protein